MPCGLQVRRGSRIFVQTFSFLHCSINISLIVCFLMDGAGAKHCAQARADALEPWALRPLFRSLGSAMSILTAACSIGFSGMLRNALSAELRRMAGAISAADVCASSRRLRAARVEPQLLVLPWLPSARE